MDLTPNDHAIAHRKGSRLFWEQQRTRFLLEGQGGGFPVEAFDFRSAGLPPGAAWKLNFEAADLERPFMSAVRLLVNTAHPRSADILSAAAGLLQSVVFHGVLEQLLLTVADGDAPTNIGYEEGTAGAVLDDLAEMYLGCDLHNAVLRIRGNRSLMLTRLQASTAFLEGASA